MRKIPLATALATVVAFVAWPTSAPAQVAQGQLGVQIRIEDACDISGGGSTLGSALLDFGTHSLLQDAITAQTASDTEALQVQCTPGVRYLLTFGEGQHSSGSGPQNRRMACSGNSIPYQLFADAARSMPLGSIGPNTATGAVETIIVYGTVPALTPAPPRGLYQDTVLITLTF